MPKTELCSFAAQGALSTKTELCSFAAQGTLSAKSKLCSLTAQGALSAKNELCSFAAQGALSAGRRHPTDGSECGAVLPGLRRAERAVLKRKTEFLIKNDEFNVFDRLQGLEMRKNAFFAAKNILVITPKLRLVNYTKCTNGVFDYKAGSFFETVFFMGFLGFSSDFERNVRNNDVGGAFRFTGKSPIYIDKSRIISEYP